jgi:drug/metabolite transporter (DMT)-like permease
MNLRNGILCIVASAFGFALMAFFVRLCDDFGGSVSCFQKSFFRNVIALVIALAVFAKRHGSPVVHGGKCAGAQSAIPGPSFIIHDPSFVTRHSFLHLILRSVFGTVGIFANFYALSRIPIGEAMTLNKTAPFFTVFFSWLFLGEKVSRRQALCLVLAFFGAMLVMKPGFGGGNVLAAAVALTGGLGAGLAYVCVHQLGRMKVDGAFIVLFFSAFSCLASLPFMAADFAPMTWSQVAILLGAGVGAAIGQFGVTAAYRYAEPRSIAAFDYTNVIFTALFGFAFFGQIPDFLSAAGFAVILLAALRLSCR